MTTPSPGLTKFEVAVQPKDGTRHYYLSCDVDQIVLPTPQVHSIAITDGITTEVSHVYVCPTMDPVVRVRGRTLFPETAAEAKEIADLAARQEGWKVS